MVHPLYHHACRLVGRPVYAHHFNGRVYHGWLHTVHANGVYLTPMGTRPVSAADPETHIIQLNEAPNNNSPEHVYAPGWYFAFGALAGLTAAAVAPYFW